ncbi:MAG: ABC transporter permease [Solirubrobacteraceae bacterium]|jgi:ABC-2 type transport system permease protein
MTATSPAPGLAAPALASAVRPAAGAWRVSRAERRKLSAQLSTRLLALICVVGPFAFAGILKVQSGTPADTLFGVWVHSSGFAVSLVVLGFAGQWGFPLLAGVLAGDMFSAEDRYGTWKTVLTRSRNRQELFAGKLLAALLFALGLVALTAVSSIVAGVVLVGDQPLVNLSGILMSSGHCLALVAAAWLTCVLPVLAYTSLAILFSVVTRNGIVGVVGPIIVALVTQLLDLIGKGVWVHMLLIGSAFDGWHGLFTAHPFYGPLLLSGAVSAIWIIACLSASWRLLLRRDFIGAPVSRRSGWVTAVRLVVAAIVVVAVLSVASNWGPVGITAPRLRAAITPEFNAITVLQQRLFGRTVPANATFDVTSFCNRRGAAPLGPGDWSCTLDVYLPQPGRVPFTQTPVEYDVSVQANGCYKAESPPAYVGQQTVRDAAGHAVVNPLFVVYGCFNVL